MIANHGGYRVLEDRLRGFHGNERTTGMDLRDPPVDFVARARSFGVRARRVTRPGELAPALAGAVAREGPDLLDVVVNKARARGSTRAEAARPGLRRGCAALDRLTRSEVRAAGGPRRPARGLG